MADARLSKPRVRVIAGGTLQTEQIVDANATIINQLFAKVDTDEVLKKAGISRASLKTMTFDDEIDQALDRRYDALTNASFTLSPSDGQVAEFVFTQLAAHLETILTASLDSRFYGYDVAEMVWTSTEQQQVITTPMGKDDFGNVVYRYDYNGVKITETQYRNLFNKGTKLVKSITSKPLQWFEPTNEGLLWRKNKQFDTVNLSVQTDFIWRYLYQRNKPSYDNPRGKALMSRVYWLWYFKTNGWRFWAKFLERFGSPLLIGKSSATSQNDMQTFADQLLAAHNSGVFAVNIQEDVTAIGANGNGEAFAKFDDAIKKRIVTYLLGQTLTSGTDSGGTYGQGVVHQEQQEIIFASDRKHAIKAVQQFIDVICYANGFEPPVFEWVSDKGLQLERANRDTVLYGQGVRFTKAYFADMYDLRQEHFYVEGENQQPLPQVNTQKTALAKGMMAATQQFTDEQQQLENLGNFALEQSTSPIDTKAIKAAIEQADSKEDMIDHLFELVGGSLSDTEMVQLVTACQMASDLHGLVDETVGK